MIRLFLEPLDVLLFRKSQPFAAGETSRAASIFPPSPIPFQGAIRTAILRALGIPFGRLCGASLGEDPQLTHVTELIGNPRTEGDFGRLRIRGPHLARRQGTKYEVLFPAPRNALWVKESRRFRLLTPAAKGSLADTKVGGGCPRVPNSYTLLWDSSAERPGEPTQGLWLTASALRSFLFDKQNPTAQAVFDRDLFVIERRCGIEIDTARKTASKGKLFGVDFVRLQPGVGFLLEVELIGDSGSELPGLLPAEGFLYLGGERRTVHYRSVGNGEVSEYTQLLTPPQQIGPQFTLLLVTPTLFRVTSPGGTGWLPDWINEETLEGGLPDAPRFRILSAALGKPIPIGGWDLAKRQPKALRWAVPAGSAYYCELLNGGDGAGAYHGRVISALHPEVGMGQVLVGRWPDAQ